MKTLKSRISVVVSLFMLTFIITANIKLTTQNTGTISTCGIGYDYYTNY